MLASGEIVHAEPHCGGQLKIIASIEEPQLIAKNPVAPGARSGGAVPERAAAGGAGAAGAVQPAVNWTMSSNCVGG
jgi:hypothetical protein